MDFASRANACSVTSAAHAPNNVGPPSPPSPEFCRSDTSANIRLYSGAFLSFFSTPAFVHHSFPFLASFRQPWEAGPGLSLPQCLCDSTSALLYKIRLSGTNNSSSCSKTYEKLLEVIIFIDSNDDCQAILQLLVTLPVCGV